MFWVCCFFSFSWQRQCNFIFFEILLFWHNYKLQVEWYNIWLDTLDNFGKLHEGGEIAKLIEAKALQVYVHQTRLCISLKM
jgi:hypothetical protein